MQWCLDGTILNPNELLMMWHHVLGHVALFFWMDLAPPCSTLSKRPSGQPLECRTQPNFERLLNASLRDSENEHEHDVSCIGEFFELLEHKNLLVTRHLTTSNKDATNVTRSCGLGVVFPSPCHLASSRLSSTSRTSNPGMFGTRHRDKYSLQAAAYS